MANVVVTLRVMPKTVGTDFSKIETEAKKEIIEFCNSQEFKISLEPIAFGLKALNIIFVMNESIGSTEELERNISNIEGVESVEVIDVRRAIG
ncbi:MAG: elongation factor 1-beta [Nanoarchaeota archaeon]